MRFAPLAVAALIAASFSAQASSRVVNRRLQNNQTLGEALHASGLPDEQVEGIIGALQGVFDFRTARPGDQLRIVIRDGELDFFDYRRSALEEWSVRREGEKLLGFKREFEVERQITRVSLDIQSSLYEAALAAGEDPMIAMVLSDVFAWDIDFYQDVRKGDRATALVEKYLTKGRFVRYGEVLAAQYEGESVGHKEVFRYALPSGSATYFQADGSSARKSFLKSPLKYASVTSRFGGRMHPVLKYYKAHNGVDYGAAVGTPVWAVADGTVTKAAFDGAAGKHVCVRHMNSFETCYLHLSRFGAGIRVGARVSQKQVIALSGNTGRSTGPHLHYALKRGGSFVNPLSQNFPRAEPLPKDLLADFQAAIRPLAAQLEGLPVVASASASAPAGSALVQ